jgi:1-deoxy-D-xylulose-5-phosphate reductoisomerase
MGQKISIDSATMMNKALEVIEAHVLFAMPSKKIEVLIHPESIIHSMVEYRDGSVLAQMGASDMRTPIAHALAWPERMNTPGQRLDFTQIKKLTFEVSDTELFPALRLAYEALDNGQAACVALNAANEIAVEAFLQGRIGFLGIQETICHIMDNTGSESLNTLEDIIAFDEAVRRASRDYINVSSTRSTAVYS